MADKNESGDEEATNARGSAQRLDQLRILEAFGQFEFDPEYDYKAERNRRQAPVKDLGGAWL
jgi:hypothetical protein